MALYQKKDGTWHRVSYLYRKVAGSWKWVPTAYAKVGGDWKTSDLNVIPTGIILPYQSAGSAPEGFENLSTDQDRYVIGAGGALTVGDTGGTNPHTFGSSSSAGSHDGMTFARYSAYTSGSVAISQAASSGAHEHALVLTWNPATRETRLIRSTQDHFTLPANVGVFSTSALAGMTELSDSTRRYLRHAATNDTTAAASSAESSSAGNHNHEGIGSPTTTASGDVYNNVTTGNHTHTLGSLTLTDNLYRALLRLWTDTENEFAAVDGMIGLWLGATAPYGWYFCNGDNGTPDLRDRFLCVKNEVGMEGTGALNATVSLQSAAWTHGHIGSATTGQFTSMYHHEESKAHSHSFNQNATYNSLKWKAYNFIMKKV